MKSAEVIGLLPLNLRLHVIVATLNGLSGHGVGRIGQWWADRERRGGDPMTDSGRKPRKKKSDDLCHCNNDKEGHKWGDLCCEHYEPPCGPSLGNWST